MSGSKYDYKYRFDLKFDDLENLQGLLNNLKLDELDNALFSLNEIKGLK